MQYHGQGRLLQATSTSFGGDGKFRYQYDVHDNLVSTHLGGVRANNYWYDARNQLTNVRDDAGATIMGLAWDAQGNLATRNGQSYRFDLGNRLREVVGVESYRYDAQGRRVTAVDGSGQRTRSFYGASGQLLYEARRGQTAANHIYLGNRLLATRKGTAVTWRHVDALGSPVATTNASAAVVERQQYEPYGAALGGATDGVGYTGHVMDAVTGLTYMQQRYYDPMLGVFLSVDPVTAYSNPIGAFDRYRYAANNPYKFVDPDGRDIKCAGNSCQLVPIGGNLPAVNFPRPDGFPASISEKDSTFHHVYRFTDLAGSGDAAYSQRLNNQLIKNPTPMQDKPATLQGNKIDVNANNAISKFTGQDNVMSYQVPLQDGASAVLNVTTGDHAATWGIVLRMVQPGQNGAQNIVTYGEGNSFLQRAFDPNNNQSREVWSKSAEEITRRTQP